MESASPEPSGSRGHPPTTRPAAQGEGERSEPVGGDRAGEGERSEPVGGDRAGEGERSEPVGGDHVVRVSDEQTDPVDLARLERLARHVLVTLAVPVELELSIGCVGTPRMRMLNEAHLGGDGPTDVLAFPIDTVDDVVEGVPGVLGDVVVCPPVAGAQAATHGRTPQSELDLLVVHGILHLLGHDHAVEQERRTMFGLTESLLEEFAAPDARR